MEDKCPQTLAQEAGQKPPPQMCLCSDEDHTGPSRAEHEGSAVPSTRTSGTSTSCSGESPPSSLVFRFLLLRTLWMKFLWKSQM